MGITGRLSSDNIKKYVLKLFGDGPARSVANRTVIELADGRNFGGCACEKRLVSAIHFIARDSFLNHLYAEIAGDGHDGIPGDTV